ncbi:MarR family winged helix-turn-helix transcriptional regulator [Haploplasma axanthum]|uniref:Transcriptional repressor MprA n=1 Tax=Haploplasma axanthum TaxID=29552 RepID=A0A449BEY0_HAPAX|nr:MarR family transcriptional regulator [Haploplasma axanthum]VEU80997.1 transcriptional repressor MprA [Haploplasma axanthum]
MKKYQNLQTLDINLQKFRKNGAYKRYSKELTDADLNVLFCIKFHDDSREKIKLTDIALRLGLTLPAVTHKVNDLEERGLIIKIASNVDKRIINLEMTTEAHKYVDQVIDKYYSPLIKISNYLGEEDTKALNRIIRKINSLGKLK